MNFSSFPKKIINYFKEVKTETKKVNWPTKKEATKYTLIVIAVIVVVSVFLGFFDIIFTLILDKFIL